ncbi:F-box protein CPR1 [Quercus suber]|uniref:F-box protein CPR1 n=1 Tax=Quercus suber TaxID=58331 RepID=UPI000CE1A4A7|nr:F-box protein CPR1-like [Quercus suber]POF22701.1 f-box protein cpr30 [Quercus suber]
MSDSLSSEEVSKSMCDSLRPEIMTDVFLRLPVKSIITCTCVSKTWKYLIQNPTFISNHLHHSNNNNHPLLLFGLNEENKKVQYVLHFDDNQDFNEYTRFDCDPFRVVGTCNGLIFLADGLYGYCYIIYNPCVRKFVKLPKPNINFSDFNASGFAFDSKTNDYKVVRFVTPEQKVQKGKSPVEVYSLSTGKWRMVTALPPVGAARDSYSNAFVNGALHWVALRKTRNEPLFFVMVFDLGEEVFREIALPKPSDHWVSVSISTYGNSLALRQFFFHGLRFSIWVMKDYADASSWTKIITLPDEGLIEGIPRSHCIPRPIGFRKSGEFILDMYGEYLVSRDLETQEIKDLRIRGYGCYLVDSYVESLVLLDKPNQLRKRQKRKRSNDRQDTFYCQAYFDGFPFCSSYIPGFDYEFDMNINSYC